MENDVHIAEYFKRIEIDYPTDGCNEEYLNQLHVNHLTHIPFETFDIIDLKELNISLDYIFDRLVRQNRGGVCFQMNGLLGFILQKLNCDVKIIPCCVYHEQTSRFLARSSHAALFVTLDNGTEYLCDVGYGRNFLTPLYFRIDCIQYASNGFFRLTKSEDGLNYQVERGFLTETDRITIPTSVLPRTHIIDINPECIKWIISYKFPIDFYQRSTKLDDFKDICSYIIHAPDVILNHCTICRIYTYKPVNGAYGIIGKEYWQWVTENGIETREHYPILDNDDEIKKLLKEKFHLTIERKLRLVDDSIRL